jgi:phage N-6-adenine-methyltransferase
MSEPKQKPGRSKQDYGTPWEFVRAVEKRFGRLDVDLAARSDNAKAPAFIGPDQDSLSVPWAAYFRARSMLAWLNPPFADIEPWAAKCLEETRAPSGLRVIMLTPASVGSNWFAAHVHRKALVLALNGRITFEGTKDPYPKDCMLSLFGFGETGFDVWKWTAQRPPAGRDIKPANDAAPDAEPVCSACHQVIGAVEDHHGWCVEGLREIALAHDARELAPVPADAPPAVHDLVAEVRAEGGDAGLLAPVVRPKILRAERELPKGWEPDNRTRLLLQGRGLDPAAVLAAYRFAMLGVRRKAWTSAAFLEWSKSYQAQIQGANAPAGAP